MRDLHSNIDIKPAFLPAVYTADSTVISVDRSGYESVEFVVYAGAGGITFDATNKVEFTLTHSDDDTTFTGVDINDVLGAEGGAVGEGGIVLTFDEARATAATYKFGYIGGKRYTRLLANFSGTHGTGTALAAVAVLSHGSLMPSVA